MAHVVLLRGVNLGKRKVVMADLRKLLNRLGFADAQTLLASGNVVLDGIGRRPVMLEAELEAAITKHYGFGCEVFVRTAAEWRAIITRNPFPKEAQRDPSKLILFALKEAPPAAAGRALQAAITGPEITKLSGREAWVFYPHGQGQSRMGPNVIEKHLGTRSTGRNWNTVLKLATLVDC